MPVANVGDLMLRADVVEACKAGHFSVYAVDSAEQALELFLGEPLASVVAIGERRLEQLWSVSRPRPT